MATSLANKRTGIRRYHQIRQHPCHSLFYNSDSRRIFILRYAQCIKISLLILYVYILFFTNISYFVLFCPLICITEIPFHRRSTNSVWSKVIPCQESYSSLRVSKCGSLSWVAPLGSRWCNDLAMGPDMFRHCAWYWVGFYWRVRSVCNAACAIQY